MTRLFILVLFILTVSCMPVNKKSLVGTYQYNGKISSGTLLLGENTFKYLYEAPLLNQQSEGVWKIYKGQLYFKSDKVYRSDYIEVEEYTSEKKCINIIDSSNLNLGGVSVKLNDTLNFLADLNGEIYPDKNIEISKIEVVAIGLSLKNNTYLVKSQKSNKFVVKVFQQHETKVYFDDERLKFNSKQISIRNLKFKRTK